MPSNNVDNSNIVEDIHVSSKTASVIEDISLVLAYRLLIEVHMSSNSTIDDVDEIIEPNTPQCQASYSSSPVLNIVLWTFQSIHFLMSHFSSLP